MKSILYTALFIVLGTTSLYAQKMPERSLIRKGNRAYNDTDYEKSVSRYNEALKVAPESFEAIYNLGNAMYKSERYDKAVEVMGKASLDSLRTDQDRALAYYNLGNAQFKQEKLQEALESYKQSLRMNPTDMEAKYNYAYTKKLLEDQQNEDQNKDQDKDQDKQQDQQQNQDQKDQNQDKSDQDQQQGQGGQQKMSPQEQEQILEAIQAQEDKTQEKLNEKKAVIVRGKKSW